MFISPLTDDGGYQRAILVMVDAGVTRGARQGLHLIRDTGSARTGVLTIGSDGQCACRRTISFLKPALRVVNC